MTPEDSEIIQVGRGFFPCVMVGCEIQRGQTLAQQNLVKEGNIHTKSNSKNYVLRKQGRNVRKIHPSFNVIK